MAKKCHLLKSTSFSVNVTVFYAVSCVVSNVVSKQWSALALM